MADICFVFGDGRTVETSDTVPEMATRTQRGGEEEMSLEELHESFLNMSNMSIDDRNDSYIQSEESEEEEEVAEVILTFSIY